MHMHLLATAFQTHLLLFLLSSEQRNLRPEPAKLVWQGDVSGEFSKGKSKIVSILLFFFSLPIYNTLYGE